MNDIGKEYATALFMLACEENAKQEYADALKLIFSTFENDPEYMDFLLSPGISKGERLESIIKVFADKIPDNVLSFLQLLCEKGRISSFNKAYEEFKILLDASNHISQAKVTSAVELTEIEKQKLNAKLENICNGKVKTEYFLDETLLGGIVVEIDSKVIDGSLRHRLSQVKEGLNA